MARIFIASTPLTDLRPLAWQGVQTPSCYDQLSRLLESKLGPRHAALLAEPMSDAASAAVDWYAVSAAEDASISFAGQSASPVKLLDLPVDAQNAARAALQQLGQEISSVAQTLKNSGDSNSIMAGALLEMSICFPAEDYLYVLAGQPIITGWGYAPGGAGAQAESLTRLRAAAPLFTPPFAAAGVNESVGAENSLPEQEPQQDFAAFGGPTASPEALPSQESTEIRHVFPFPWAILAFLVGVLICIFLLFWVLPKFGLPAFGGPGSCSRTEGTSVPPPAPVPNAGNATSPNESSGVGSAALEDFYRAQGKEEALRVELDRLRREYEGRLLKCRQVEATPSEDNLHAEGSSVPPVPELNIPFPPAEEKPRAETKPEQRPKEKETPKSDRLVIPEDSNDLAFLEGCWDAKTGLKSTRTDMPISVKYCFDGKGSGTVSIIERDENRREMQNCTGPATASLNGGELFINDLGATCPSGETYEKEKIKCRNADQGKALCTGVGVPSGETNWQDKPFMRTGR